MIGECLIKRLFGRGKRRMLNVKRQELKYLLHVHEARMLRRRLLSVVPRDPYSQNGGYFIRSLYFDNPANDGHYDRMEGYEMRKKFRLRIYEFSDKAIIKFEIKVKDNNTIVKETTLISRKDAEAVMKGNTDCLLGQSEILNRVYFYFRRHYYRPAVIVDYRRDAFFLDYNDIRVTFDTCLRKSSSVHSLFDANLKTIPVLHKRHIILEVKYNHFFPGWLTDLLSGFNFQRCAQSKYCFSRMLY